MVYVPIWLQRTVRIFSKQKTAMLTLLIRKSEKLDSTEYRHCKQLHFSNAAYVWILVDLQP